METILVIDDETSILNMFRLYLGFHGHNVLTAENGRIGLEVFKKESPSVVFLDIRMPGIDGFEVLKQIKQISPETDVIMITGHGDKELADKASKLHADDFINKPFQNETLEEALERMDARRKRQEAKDGKE